MKYIQTQLPFWGNRTHLHSSQLIDELGRTLPKFSLGNSQSLCAKFRSFLRSQGEFYIINNDNADQPHIGSFVLDISDRKVTIGLRETDTPVVTRLPDDEKDLIKVAKLNVANKTSVITQYDPERFYSVIVALNKGLIIRLYPPDNDQAWILAKLDMKNPFNQAESQPEIECQVTSVIANKMINTRLLINGTKAGSTVFTKVDKP